MFKGACFAGERVHGDDSTVPVMAKGKTDTARIWVTFATIVRSAERRRRRLCFIIHEIEAASIPTTSEILPLASYRPTPTADITSSYEPAEVLDQLLRRHVGAMQGGNSSNSPICSKRPAESSGRRRRHLFRPWPSKRFQRIDALFAIEREINGLSAMNAKRRARTRAFRSSPV